MKRVFLVFIIFISNLWAADFLLITDVDGQAVVNNQKKISLFSTVKAGDTISTSKEGKVEVQVNNLSVIRIAPNSKVLIRKKTEKETELEVLKGEVWNNINFLNKDEKFKVKTDVAQMAIKGTIFRVICVKPKEVDLRVYRGVVEVKTQDKVIDVERDKRFYIQGDNYQLNKIVEDNIEQSAWTKFNKEKDRKLLVIKDLLVKDLDKEIKEKFLKNRKKIEQTSKAIKVSYSKLYLKELGQVYRKESKLTPKEKLEVLNKVAEKIEKDIDRRIKEQKQLSLNVEDLAAIKLVVKPLIISEDFALRAKILLSKLQKALEVEDINTARNLKEKYEVEYLEKLKNTDIDKLFQKLSEKYYLLEDMLKREQNQNQTDQQTSDPTVEPLPQQPIEPQPLPLEPIPTEEEKTMQ